jgi:hypothetical protein
LVVIKVIKDWFGLSGCIFGGYSLIMRHLILLSFLLKESIYLLRSEYLQNFFSESHTL